MGLTMALRLIIGALKRAYPRVALMTTDELQHLMKKTASQSGYRKLVLLVSKRYSTSLVFQLFVYCVYRRPRCAVSKELRRLYRLLSACVARAVGANLQLSIEN